MPFGINALMLGAKRLIENWDNLDAWVENTYQQNSAYAASGTGEVSANRYQAASYPAASGGPLQAFSLGYTPNYLRLTASARITTNSSGRGIVYIGLADDADPQNEKIFLYHGDGSNSSASATTIIGSTEGGATTVEDRDDSADSPNTYDVDIEVVKVGNDYTFTVTGDLNASALFANAAAINSLFVQVVRTTGVTVINQSVGPITLEYS